MIKILFVCMGNICRSPVAEGLLRDKLIKQGKIEGKDFIIDSAGTISAWEGSLPDSRSIDVTRKHGIDITTQRSRPLKPADGAEYDVIVCMDDANVQSAKARIPEKFHSKIRLLDDHDVEDPYSSHDEGFEKMFTQIELATDRLISQLFS